MSDLLSLVILNCMFYVACLHFAFGGSGPVYCCCNWKGEWRGQGVNKDQLGHEGLKYALL